MHRPQSCTVRSGKRGIFYLEDDTEPTVWRSLHARWRQDWSWKQSMTKNGWTEDTIKAADEEAQKPGDFVPMSWEEREEYLPAMVLRQSKVGGASIKTTAHPAYQQALDQCPNDSGARSSTDPAPRRYPVHDHIRHDETWEEDWQDEADWQDDEDWKDDAEWYEDKHGDTPWRDADHHDRARDRRYR